MLSKACLFIIIEVVAAASCTWPGDSLNDEVEIAARPVVTAVEAIARKVGLQRMDGGVTMLLEQRSYWQKVSSSFLESVIQQGSYLKVCCPFFFYQQSALLKLADLQLNAQ